MDGIMSRETIFHQAVQCRAHDGLIVECELIFDNDVDRGMKVSSALGQADSSIPRSGSSAATSRQNTLAASAGRADGKAT